MWLPALNPAPEKRTPNSCLNLFVWQRRLRTLMDAKESFARKLISRLDKLDRSAVENYILELMGEFHQLETVLNQLDQGILLIRGSGILDFVNRTAEKFLDIQSWTKGKTSLADFVSDTELAVYLSRNAVAC